MFVISLWSVVPSCTQRFKRLWFNAYKMADICFKSEWTPVTIYFFKIVYFFIQMIESFISKTKKGLILLQIGSGSSRVLLCFIGYLAREIIKWPLWFNGHIGHQLIFWAKRTEFDTWVGYKRLCFLSRGYVPFGWFSTFKGAMAEPRAAVIWVYFVIENLL